MPGPYATAADLDEFMGEAPSDADRLLRRASEEVDTALITAVYPVDEQGNPTNPEHAEAMKNATCAIVEWWGETGDPTGAGSAWTSVGAGSVNLSRGGQGSTGSTQVRPGYLPTRAWGFLHRSGLLPGTVFTL